MIYILDVLCRLNPTAVWPMTEAGGFKYQVNDGYGGRGVQGRLKSIVPSRSYRTVKSRKCIQ